MINLIAEKNNLSSDLVKLIFDYLAPSRKTHKKLMLDVAEDINLIREIVLDWESYPIKDIVGYLNIGRRRVFINLELRNKYTKRYR
jgi:hypothetical protein